MYCRDTTDVATAHIAGLEIKSYYAGLTQITDRSLQILGSIGITRDTVVERIYRDIRPFRIYDGPSEVHRHALARRIVSRNTRQRQ